MALEEFWLGQLYNRNGQFAQAARHYEAATRLEPEYAAAYAMQSVMLHLAEAMGTATRAEVEAKGRPAARKALELDPEMAEAYLGTAGIQWFEDWNWTAAEQSFRRALELNPGSADVCSCRILFLVVTGRVAEAIAFAQSRLQLDPLSNELERMYGYALLYARRYQDSEAQLKRALELNPQDVVAVLMLSDVYVVTGKLEQARMLLDRPEFRTSPRMAAVYARLGRRADALRVLSALGENWTDQYGIALAYFDLRDQERGFQWLQRAIERRQFLVGQAPWDPVVPDAIRMQPRYQELTAKLNLPAF
jgi:tetratricopeptide (TPR) repeat protein